jgi:S1-C subfamily serine protease
MPTFPTDRRLKSHAAKSTAALQCLATWIGFPRPALLLLVAFAGLWSGLGHSARAQLPADSPRNTRLVQIIQQIEPAVVALFSTIPNGISSGSGSLIHAGGFVLTNNHVLPNTEGFALLHPSQPTRFRVVCRFPESDLAIVRLDPKPDGKPYPTVPLGFSRDLLNGESVVVAGNPGGRGIVYTSGIVSSREVFEGGPNAMVMSNYVNDRRDRFIQFDAASNRGNSGGPLVNMDGGLIGVVAAVVDGEQNVGLAIPVDRVRSILHRMLHSELFHGRTLGIQIDPAQSKAVIAAIEDDSPASRSGLSAGDEIVSANGASIASPLDWWFALETELPSRPNWQLQVQRDAGRREVQLEPQATLPLPAVSEEGNMPGWRYQLYDLKTNLLPDFKSLQPVETGIAKELDLEKIASGRKDYFAVVLEGRIRVDADGLYRTVLVSDDGSKLYLHDRLIIDHDGNHPPKAASDVVFLEKGWHPIRIEYFQGNGQRMLQLAMQPFGPRAAVLDGPLPAIKPEIMAHVTQ